ncbi:MAG TPA: hypothetical protein VGC07_11195 [Granulicella sp.]
MASLCLGSTALLNGCALLQHHAPPTRPPVIPARAIAPIPPPPPIMERALPELIRTAEPVRVVVIRPRRIVRRPTAKNAPADVAAPGDTSTTAAADDTVVGIGELSDGGASNPVTMQEARSLIAESQRRLDRISKPWSTQQFSQLRRVRDFLNQSRQALNTGDAEGAKTLATKAKLLLDDVAK